MSNQPRLYCTFRLGERLFGVDVLDVKEVNTETVFTPVPHAPAAVRGYVNLRGQIHLILDPRGPLGRPPIDQDAAGRLVIFKPAVGEAFGILVDSVGDIVPLRADEVEPWQGDGSPADGLIDGVGKLGGELIVLLRARRLLAAAESS
jgi:purine-binding chemotaxis protein CheW